MAIIRDLASGRNGRRWPNLTVRNLVRLAFVVASLGRQYPGAWGHELSVSDLRREIALRELEGAQP